MDECLFCKIIKGNIPSAKVYEDENTYAFLDIGPVNKGHTLVIPKIHKETILDMDEKTACDIIKTVKKVAKAIKESTGAQGFNIMMNNYKVSGQIIPHAHMHIIPRFETDGLRHWPQGSYESGEAEKVANSIKEKL